MRRTHLRGHTNILKRLLVHVGGFNLGLFMRTLCGVGTPRGLQGRAAALIARLVACWTLIVSLWPEAETRPIDPAVDARPFLGVPLLPLNWSERGL